MDKIPSMTPPSVANDAATAEAEPMPINELEIKAIVNSAIMAVPTLTPPAMKEDAKAAVYIAGKKVNALWSINQPRNVWAGFDDVGWRKFSDASDSASTAFTILASVARVLQIPTVRREESDNKIHEFYMW
jgi:hypothetical protein